MVKVCPYGFDEITFQAHPPSRPTKLQKKSKLLLTY